MRLLILAACLLTFSVSPQVKNPTQEKSPHGEKDGKCEQNPKLVGKCFVVHGRLRFYNGAPSARIWKIGTKRLLGVHESVLPGQLGSKMTSFNTEAFGDFRVCPLSKGRPGVMQIVCIESTKNVRYKHLKRY